MKMRLLKKIFTKRYRIVCRKDEPVHGYKVQKRICFVWFGLKETLYSGRRYFNPITSFFQWHREVKFNTEKEATYVLFEFCRKSYEKKQEKEVERDGRKNRKKRTKWKCVASISQEKYDHCARNYVDRGAALDRWTW